MKFVSLADAAARVRSGQRLYIQGAGATPKALIEAIVGRSPALKGIETVSMHTEGPALFAATGMERRFRHNALFIGANVRNAVQEGRADYTPIFLSEIPELFAPGGSLPLDVALLHVAPPDDRGYCSLGVSVDCALAAAEQARLVIAQVNPRMPRTGGHQLLASSINLAVAVDDELFEPVPAPQSPESAAIGRHVAELIEDGSTLQIGIGAVPDAVVASLRDHHDLGLHTEMFSDGVLPLIESGVINGARKTLHPGIAVSAFVLGSRRLYDFVDNNPAVELHPVNYTNDVDVIAANYRMVAINSALSVDLTGQVAADSIGPRFYSGIGGQVDFIRGAARSPSGVPVIALASTAANGTISRITPELVAGSGVTTTRGDVHWIVTEYGARNLHGRTIRDRARLLIEIAHPDFREQLYEAAGHLGYLGSEFPG